MVLNLFWIAVNEPCLVFRIDNFLFFVKSVITRHHVAYGYGDKKIGHSLKAKKLKADED